MAITPTEEQLAAVAAVGERSGNVEIQAFAGCAKSTTLELASRGVKVPALSIQFNKKTAQESAKRLPGNFTVKTLNGLGHMAWVRALPQSARVELDDKKLGKLVTEVSRDFKIKLAEDQWGSLRSMVGLVMQQGLVPEALGIVGLIPDTEESWKSIADQLWIGEEDFVVLLDLAREVLLRDIKLAKQGVISFDDQVYCPVVLGGRWPQFPVVFGDEAQDFSPLNHLAIGLSLRPDGRLIIVGDNKQSLYAFRGADGRSMDNLKKQSRGDWKTLPLATTFRCPKVVVERQQGHAPGFRAWHTNPDGRFHRASHVDELGEGGWTWKELASLLPSATATMAILCRNNAPLMDLAFKLIRQGVGPSILGRDIGKGLITLSRKIIPEDLAPADTCRGLIELWIESESSLALANGNEEKVGGILDRGACLLAVLGAGAPDAGSLRKMLEKLFAREGGEVTLGSIHRAKGLEWDLVVHLDPWRIPSRAAKEAKKAGYLIPWEQEMNAQYVVETRTKHTLVSASLEDFRVEGE